MNSRSADIVIIGAGIAGASAAAELTRTHRVILLERESAPGYHATGRSAALFSEIYGNDTVRALSRASRDFFFSPPDGFCAYPLVKPRSLVHFARSDQVPALETLIASEESTGTIKRIDAGKILDLCPVLRPEAVAGGGAYERDASDVDVHGLHQGYLRQCRRQGGHLVTDAEVTGLRHDGAGWTVTTRTERYCVPVVVNAAGAWADCIAEMAGVAPIAIQPCRRTAALIALERELSIDTWPMMIAIDENFYFKPDAGLLLLSPADETPIVPCDVQPEDLDVAIAIDRLEQATTLKVNRLRQKWAGLRSFASDRSPVIGFDVAMPGFFWLAGQGGYGIQTAPAAAILAAALLRGDERPPSLENFDPAQISPNRFAARQR